jgi:hypothetical protein
LVEQRVDPVRLNIVLSDAGLTSFQGLSQRELHMLHAEVKALQGTLGISYKDAAHRLFMAETERVKKADSAAKGFSAVRKKIADTINEDILPAIKAIDNGEFDDYILRDGKWMKKRGDTD